MKKRFIGCSAWMDTSQYYSSVPFPKFISYFIGALCLRCKTTDCNHICFFIVIYFFLDIVINKFKLNLLGSKGCNYWQSQRGWHGIVSNQIFLQMFIQLCMPFKKLAKVRIDT